VGSITAIFPRRREVALGGRTFHVDELRLADLADLQDWLDRSWADPLAGLRELVVDMGDAERRAALAPAYDLAEAGPPTCGDERGRALFATGAGILEIFRVALRRHHPELDAEVVATIAERTTRAEYAALRRALYGEGPLDEIEAWLKLDQGPSASPIGWPQAAAEVAEMYGWSLEYIEGLTVRQFRSARSRGRPSVRGTPVAPRTNLKAVVAAARRKWFGEESNIA